MSENVEVHLRDGYLYIEFKGEFSVEAARNVIDTMGAAAAEHRCRRILFDCRGMSGRLKVLDRFLVGAYAGKTVAGKTRTAMLGRVEDMLPDDFLENVARNRGVNMKIFKAEGDALEWLMQELDGGCGSVR